LTFDHNFGNHRPIFKILLLTDSQGNSLRNNQSLKEFWKSVCICRNCDQKSSVFFRHCAL